MKPNTLACGLFNGNILIVDAEKYFIIQELTGCSDKVLTLKWHPNFDYILASGSSDQIVRVWDIKNVSIKLL
jgi:WD40 repeat protein